MTDSLPKLRASTKAVLQTLEKLVNDPSPKVRMLLRSNIELRLQGMQLAVSHCLGPEHLSLIHI